MTIETAGLGYMGAGLAILSAGTWLGRRQWRFQAKARVTTGVVTEVLQMRQQSSSFGKTISAKSYAPVVEFRADSGKLIPYRCDTYTYPNPYAVGMRLEVRYDPANPERAQLTNPVFAWVWPVGISVLGVVFLVLGAVLQFRAG